MSSIEYTPTLTRIHWDSAYRLTLPYAIDPRLSFADDAINKVIAYTDPVSRIKNGSLPVRYGVAGAQHEHPIIRAPFTTLGESMFSDGSFGVCYLSETVEMAAREMAERLSSIMLLSRKAWAEIEFAIIEVSVSGDFHDFEASYNRALLKPEISTQEVGRFLRAEDSSDGVLYNSLSGPRDSPALCVFRTTAIKVKRTDRRLLLSWNEGRFIGFSYKSPMHSFGHDDE